MNNSNISRKGRFAVIIPVYNHEQRVRDVISSAAELSIPLIIVDDGSTDSTYERIRDIQGITILRHDSNKGKGAAIKTGFAHALKTADWAITIDADGQHDPGNALAMIEALPDLNIFAKEAPATEIYKPIVIGMRKEMTGADVPWTSRFGRGFSNFWVWTSGGPMVKDSQSGFRIYPLPEALNLSAKADRFQFEVEILARAGWKGMPVIEVPVSVSYRPGMERISHFRPFIDFMRNSSTFARLITQRIFVPRCIRKRW